MLVSHLSSLSVPSNLHIEWAETFSHSARVPRIARAWKTMQVRQEVSYRLFAVLAFKLIKNERYKKSLVPAFLTNNIMPYYSLCKMVIFTTSQIRAIFLPIRCFLNQLFSHETTLTRFFSYMCFLLTGFYFSTLPSWDKKKEKKWQIGWQEIVLFVFVVVVVFFFF